MSKEVTDEKDYLIKDEVDEDQYDDKIEFPVPEKFNVCQWVCLAIFYLIFAFLLGFVIYFSCTWNKERPNEYA